MGSKRTGRRRRGGGKIFFFFFLSQNLVQGKYVFRPKLAGMVKTLRNRPKFDLRWNEGYYGTDLHAGTKYSGRNGTELITMIYSESTSHDSHELIKKVVVPKNKKKGLKKFNILQIYYLIS